MIGAPMRPAEGDIVPARSGVHALLRADEINRTPPKTEAALLETMREG